MRPPLVCYLRVVAIQCQQRPSFALELPRTPLRAPPEQVRM